MLQLILDIDHEKYQHYKKRIIAYYNAGNDLCYSIACIEIWPC